jgi:RnfABCDGE-type electron transport complex G subunit
MKARYVEYGGKLALVCAIAMLGVAGTWVMARERIEAGKKAAFQSAIREVLGLPADAAAPKPLNPDDPQADQVFFATIDGEKRYATQGSHQGYSGPVIIAVGAKMEEGGLTIIEARVIAQTETPGLGTRIEEQETNLTLWTTIGNALGGDTKEETDWFFLKRYRGKGISNLEVTSDPAQEASKILKITGVTVSTNAATLAVKSALRKILKRISN